MSLLALAAETAADDHGEGAAAFPPFEPWHFPSQIFWLVVLFGGLYLTLSRFVLPKLKDVMEKRGDKIAADLDEAERLNHRAEAARRDLEESLVKARADARATADAAQADASEEIRAATARSDQEIETKFEAAEARIQENRAAAMANVEAVAADAVVAIVAKLGAKIDRDAAEAAVASTLGGGEAR